MIPVKVAPGITAHVVVAGMIPTDNHPLHGRLCPVCDERLGNGPVSLVYVGREPDQERGWNAAGVAVHDQCTDRRAAAVERHDAECPDRSCSDTVIGSLYGRGDRFYLMHDHNWTAAGLTGYERHAHHTAQGHPGNWTNRDHQGVDTVPWEELPWIIGGGAAARDGAS